MKCPNCGKEAIFVNGKYVCLDCGIEISPEQQAAQNMAEVNVLDSAIPPTSGTDTGDQTIQPITSSTPDEPVAPVAVEPNEPQIPADLPPAPVTEPPVEPQITAESAEPAKPVQDYYESALSDVEKVETNSNNTGIYDFSTDEKTTETEPVSEPIEAPSAEAEEVPIANLSPSEPTTIISPEPDLPATATPDSYFAPKPFDISASQGNAATDVLAGETPIPESVPETQPIPDISSAPTTDQVSSTNEDVMTTQAQGMPPVTEPFPSAPEPISTEPIQESTPAVSGKTLDDMLGGSVSTPPTPGIDESPISAYGPTTPVVSEPTPTNITNESPMPSVESVFGDTAVTADQPKSNLPTPQDFGVAPKPTPPKKNKYIPFIVAGVAGLLLIIGVSLFLILSANKEPEYPIILSEEQKTNLSGTVSTAMQQPQGISVDYELTMDFSALKTASAASTSTIGINTTAPEGTTPAATPADATERKPYELTGSWYTDPDGDITVDSTVADVNDKRTYISKGASTYVYSVATQTYNKQEGMLITGVPAFAGVEEKTAILYTTDVKQATLEGIEQIDGANYSKYKLSVNGESIKDTLSMADIYYKDADYNTFNTDDLGINVWVSQDNKLKKITISGFVTIKTPEYAESKINITAEAVYQYLDVSIEDPGAQVEATRNTGTSVTEIAKKNEEVEASSIDNGTNDELVDERG